MVQRLSILSELSKFWVVISVCVMEYDGYEDLLDCVQRLFCELNSEW